jgi:four helix bundle protein
MLLLLLMLMLMLLLLLLLMLMLLLMLLLLLMLSRPLAVEVLRSAHRLAVAPRTSVRATDIHRQPPETASLGGVGASPSAHFLREARQEALVPFIALELAHALVRSLREPVAAIALRDASLADQLRRAATSVPLNLDEGRGRSGRDRLHLWRVAAGSAHEVASALRVAESWGYIEISDAAQALALCDQIRAILWKLTH